jgi:hypothetical protein
MTPAAAEPKVIAGESHGMRPDIAEQLSLHAQCRAIERDIAFGTHVRYGPELPADSRQTQRLIAALGVAMPFARNWPASEIAAYYQRFLFSLDPNYHDYVHNAAPRGLCADYWPFRQTVSRIESAWMLAVMVPKPPDHYGDMLQCEVTPVPAGIGRFPCCQNCEPYGTRLPTLKSGVALVNQLMWRAFTIEHGSAQ